MADISNGKTAEETTKKGDASPEQNGGESGAAPADGSAAAPPVKEMRAVVLANFGGLKAIKIQKKPEPSVVDGEVLLKVHACGLNFQDLMMRQGAIDAPKTPFILGVECAGEVVGVGEGVENVKVGDRVAALTEARAWAEVVSVPSAFVYKIPDEMSYTDAAAITLPYALGYALLFEVAALSPGKSVLLHSAGGATGQAIAQLCKTVSDVTVYGVANKGKHEAIKDSVDHVFERSNYFAELKKISPEGVDIVLDCLFGDDCSKGYALLKPMGRYIMFGSSSIVTGETKSFFSVAKSWLQEEKISPLKLFNDNKSLHGFNFRNLLLVNNQHKLVNNAVSNVYKLWQEGKIKPVVDSTWALEDVVDGMQKLHDRRNVGKVVLDLSLEPKPKPVPAPKGSKAKNDDKDKEKDAKKEGDKEEPKPASEQNGGDAPADEQESKANES